MYFKNFKLYSVVLQTCAVFVICSANSYATSLNEALVLSYQNNPEIKSAIEGLKLVDEDMPYAISGILPTVSSELQRGKKRTTYGATELDTKDDLRTIGIVQPLFKGGSTYSSIKKANNSILAARERFKEIEQNVLLAAVTAYMNLVRDEAKLELAKNNKEVLESHLQAVQTRFEIGQVTQTDIAQAKANVAQASSDIISAKRSLESSRATYIKVIGLEPVAVKLPSNPIKVNGQIDDLVKIALDHHPSIKAALYEWKAAKNDIAIKKAGLLPTVSAYANKTSATTSSSVDYNTMGITVSIPLYQSGAEYVRVRQAKISAGKASYDVEVMRNYVSENVVQAYHDYEVATSLIAANKSSVDSFEIALEGVKQESQAGLRTTIDVLDAQHDLIEAKSRLISSLRDEIVSSYNLLAKLGKLSTVELGLETKLYDAKKHAKKVKYQMIGF